YAEAINEYSKIGDEKSSLQIARAYNAIGNKEKAILQYLDIIKNNENHILARFELGKIYEKTNKDKAQVVFESLINSGSENPEFYYYLGKIIQSKLDYEEGNKALRKAITLDSTHLRSIYLLGKYYVSVEEPSNALITIELGLKTAPNDVALLNLKGLAHFNNGFYDKSAPLFQRLLELGEEKPFVYRKLGYSQFKNSDLDNAKETYWTLAEIKNNKADAYFGLGEVYLEEKKLDSAETYFKKSIKERKYIFDVEYRNLGRIARLKNQLKKSLDLYTKAWEENKANFFNYYQVCVLTDEYYKDPKIKLRYYEGLFTNFKSVPVFISERAKKRISELKEEIHYKSD
ncbi:MAG: tetratricopeptide repeat protein, partial [Flavobacteriaceae bacterium]